MALHALKTLFCYKFSQFIHLFNTAGIVPCETQHFIKQSTVYRHSCSRGASGCSIVLCLQSHLCHSVSWWGCNQIRSCIVKITPSAHIMFLCCWRHWPYYRERDIFCCFRTCCVQGIQLLKKLQTSCARKGKFMYYRFFIQGSGKIAWSIPESY